MPLWWSSGITDAIQLGLYNLPSFDPFDEIDPMIDSYSSNIDLITAIANLSAGEMCIFHPNLCR